MQITTLSGGVGGARLARGFDAIADVEQIVIVNVADDDTVHGLAVSPDLDTVLYTLADKEGPEGWGVRDDTFTVMNRLASLAADVTFKIGDTDLATNLFRTARLHEGATLTQVTAELVAKHDVGSTVLPVTNSTVRTRVLTEDHGWLSFQDYFVSRAHRDTVTDVLFDGAAEAKPGPKVIDAITAADAVIIGPSNPPLSIWPILGVPGVAAAVERARRVIAVSPLIGGKALKGPADAVLAGLGLPGGNMGVAASYEGILTDLVIDVVDAAERGRLTDTGISVHVADTRISHPDAAARLAQWLLELL